MDLIYDPAFRVEGWWDPTLDLEGWFDQDLVPGGAPPPTRDGPTYKSAASNTSGTGSSSSVSVVLPSGLNDGDVAYLVQTTNTGTDRGGPDSADPNWALQDSSVSATVLMSKVYRKELTAAESGTTVSWTLTNSQKWTVSVVVVQDDGGIDVIGTAWTSGASSTTWQLNAITPLTDDCLLVGLHAWRVNVTGTTTQTPPSNWTERVEASVNASASPTNASGINTREITGGAGVSVPQVTDGGYDQSATNHISIVLAIKPVPPPAAGYVGWGVKL